MKETAVFNKLTELDDRFDAHDARFDAHDVRFDAIEDKLKQHDASLKAIADKLLEHDDHFARLEEEGYKWRQEFLKGQDAIMKILHKLDQERIFTTEWMKRNDLRIGQHDVAIGELQRRCL